MVGSLSVVVASYNERESLPECLDRTLRFLRERVPDWEVILVDDGSTDGTGELADRLARAEPGVISLHMGKNSGMGAALLTGYRAAAKEWITMLPGDGQIDPRELATLCEAAESADLVTSLYENRLETPFRRFLSLGFRLLTVLIAGSRARTEGTYLVRREVFQELGASSHSFLLNLEIPILGRRAGYRVRTVRIRAAPRAAGVSKAATPGRIFHTLRELFALRLRLLARTRGRGREAP